MLGPNLWEVEAYRRGELQESSQHHRHEEVLGVYRR